MNNISKAFENKNAVITFITCGDPDFETTAEAVKVAEENGTDLIELGIPFSDPTAESALVQESNLRALESGATTDKIFDFVKEIRKDTSLPLIFKTYANVVFSYGTERFMSACKDIGIDGILILDLPYEEKEEFHPICQKYGIALISMIAPTSHNRIEMIAKEAEGFIYILPSPSAEINGENTEEALKEAVKIIRNTTDTPCAVDFDTTASHSDEKFADGVIISTKIATLLSKYGKDAPKHIGEYIKTLKN